MKCIGKIFGVPISIHWSFLLLAIFLYAKFGLLVFSIFTFSILVHEMAHAIVAIRYTSIKPSIALMGFGGVMYGPQTKMPTPLQETAVSVAGPFSNFLLALIALPFYSIPELRFFVALNVLLGVINLIPAPPLDGGHALKALLKLKYDELQAAKISSILGLVVCALVGPFALAYDMIFIGIIFLTLFPYLTWREYKRVRDYYV